MDEKQQQRAIAIITQLALFHDNGYGLCVLCGNDVNVEYYDYGKNEPHNAECPVTEAQALLAELSTIPSFR